MQELRETKSWLDENEYPFFPHYHFNDIGKMHYIDEGDGEVVVFLHGNPSWSFTWRKLIKGLCSNYRCIAIDHIGFGFSDKPYNWTYTAQDHAANFEKFVNCLGLQNITLVVNDWGGPIGLSYAIKYPQNVKNIIIFNSWMWSQKGNKEIEKFSGLMGGRIGKFLSKNFNFFAKMTMAMAIAEKDKVSKITREAYWKHLEKPKNRKGTWVFPREIIDASDWLDNLWQQSEKIKNKSVLIIWGMKDIAFKKEILEKWKSFFTNKTLIELENTGHFPQEEVGEELIEPIKKFLQNVGN